MGDREERIKRLRSIARAAQMEIRALEAEQALSDLSVKYQEASRQRAEWRTRAESAEGQRNNQARDIGNLAEQVSDLKALRNRLACIADYLDAHGPKLLQGEAAWWPSNGAPASAYALDLVRWADFVEATGGFEWEDGEGRSWAFRNGQHAAERGDS